MCARTATSSIIHQMVEWTISIEEEDFMPYDFLFYDFLTVYLITKKGGVGLWDAINLIPAHFYDCLEQGPEFRSQFVLFDFVFYYSKWELVLRFCWYLRNCCPLMIIFIIRDTFIYPIDKYTHRIHLHPVKMNNQHKNMFYGVDWLAKIKVIFIWFNFFKGEWSNHMI